MIKLIDLYDKNIKGFSPNITLIQCNAIMQQLAYELIVTTDTDEAVKKTLDATNEVAKLFINLMKRSYNEQGFKETMDSIATDVINVYDFFDKKTVSQSLRYFALDIGLNSESDQNYTMVTKCIELFALSKKLGLEFDFS